VLIDGVKLLAHIEIVPRNLFVSPINSTVRHRTLRFELKHRLQVLDPRFGLRH
jgi:hypothetical protein